MTLDSLKPIAQLGFRAMVAKSMQTPITMTNLKLNGGDADYANCILSADTATTSFNLLAQCGDSTLSKFMNGILPLRIISLRPNPVQDEVIVEIESPTKREATVEIYDALGAKISSFQHQISSGNNSLHLSTRDLSSGVYQIRIKGEVGDSGTRFVKSR